MYVYVYLYIYIYMYKERNQTRKKERNYSILKKRLIHILEECDDVDQVVEGNA